MVASKDVTGGLRVSCSKRAPSRGCLRLRLSGSRAALRDRGGGSPSTQQRREQLEGQESGDIPPWKGVNRHPLSLTTTREPGTIHCSLRAQALAIQRVKPGILQPRVRVLPPGAQAVRGRGSIRRKRAQNACFSSQGVCHHLFNSPPEMRLLTAARRMQNLLPEEMVSG